MENLLLETNFVLKKYGIKANKSLGQNFLVDSEVINTIVDSSNITKDDVIIEIGPGLGTLTKFLLEKAGKVICIELDSRMVKILQDRFKLYKNFELCNEDVLKVDFQSIIQKEKQSFKNVKVVANLPYYITTPIIMKLLEDKLQLKSITVMVQKEVAERLIAIPGEKEAGAITYSVYYYASSEKIVEVPKTSFVPEPKVDSEVIKLTLRNEAPISVSNSKAMFQIIKYAFMQRRKTLLNSLTNAKIFSTKEQGEKILKELNLNENIRAERLTLQNFADITNKLSKKNIVKK